MQKAKRATSIQGRKAIFIGGSSTNFSIDSEYFEELSGVPAVNMSITAGIPVEIYLKMAEIYSNSDDILVLIFEEGYYKRPLDEVSEAYLDMVILDNNLITFDVWEDFPLAFEVAGKEFLRSFNRLADTVNYSMFSVLNKSKKNRNIYIADSVNEYGDFVLHEGMPATYKRVYATAEPYTPEPDMAEFILEKIEKLEAKGVTVFITFPTTDGQKFYNYKAYYQSVYDFVKGKFGDRTIGSPFDFLYDEDFFYDTNRHIKFENRKVYTQNLFDIMNGVYDFY